MSRTLFHRLSRLEERQPSSIQTPGKGHELIAWSRAERDEKVAALKASPGWSEGDRIVAWIVVTPPKRNAA